MARVERRGPLHTTEIVLGEACWHLGGNTQPAHALLDLVRKGALILARPWPEHLAGTQQIMLKYPSMDAADASLVSLAELSPKAALVTTDRRDFQPCRGLRNRALKLILPDWTGPRVHQSRPAPRSSASPRKYGVAIVDTRPLRSPACAA